MDMTMSINLVSSGGQAVKHPAPRVTGSIPAGG